MKADGPQGWAINRRTFLERSAVGLSAIGMTAKSYAQVKGANARLRVGVIGCGGRGRSHLFTLKAQHEQDNTVEIVAVCDAYRPRMNSAMETFAAKGYMDHRELLADPDVDVVSIATPDHIHGYQAIDAVRAGKHVYCEKPVTHWRQFELIKRLAAEVKESGCAFQLGTQGMSDPAWQKMKELVRDGVIGQPVHAECGYFRTGDWGERGMPIDDPDAQPGPDLDWEAFLGDSPEVPFDVSRFFRWRMYLDYAGGPVTDLFPHALTPVVDILGVGMPDAATATGGIFRYPEREVPDTFNMLVDYPERITVAVLGTQGNDYQGTGQRGAGARVPVIRGWDGSLTFRDDAVVFVPTQEKGGKEERWRVREQEKTLNHFRNLVKAVQEGHTDTFSPVDLAYRTQTALLMAMASYREKKTARFDPAAERIVLG